MCRGILNRDDLQSPHELRGPIWVQVEELRGRCQGVAHLLAPDTLLQDALEQAGRELGLVAALWWVRVWWHVGRQVQRNALHLHPLHGLQRSHGGVPRPLFMCTRLALLQPPRPRVGLACALLQVQCKPHRQRLQSCPAHHGGEGVSPRGLHSTSRRGTVFSLTCTTRHTDRGGRRGWPLRAFAARSTCRHRCSPETCVRPPATESVEVFAQQNKSKSTAESR